MEDQMHIMTADGWKQLAPRECAAPGHVPSLLEREGIDMSYDGVAAMAAYCNGQGRGVYFTYRPDGSSWQSKGAINPLAGMWQESKED
jgi:hypothetical protein